MPLAGPGGAAEATSCYVLCRPGGACHMNASAEQRQAVRSSLETFFRSQGGPHGIVLPGDMGRPRPGLIYSAEGLQQH